VRYVALRIALSGRHETADKKVKGTFNANGQAITIMIMNAKFKAVPGSSPMCPKMGTLTASASLSTEPPAGRSVPVALG
jgi:hypothetical protein